MTSKANPHYQARFDKLEATGARTRRDRGSVGAFDVFEFEIAEPGQR
jgi:hypothetical protein